MNEQRVDFIQTNPASPDFRTKLAGQIAELVPEAVADGKIDLEKLKELLADDVDSSSERFGLFWPGKRKAIRTAQNPTTATLKPDKNNSKDWDNTQNVFIEGDNLEVLKVLQNHYYGKIKMIYIDPPYNTGKDFVYKDDFKDGVQNYLEWSVQVNEYGGKLSSNSDTEGRFHSNWLSMMYPRLKLARNLLTQDGIIFVSIDDHEHGHLRKILDEIFGAQNYVADISWQHLDTIKNDARHFSENNEYILAYARNIKSLKLRGVKKGEKQLSYYKNPDNDPRGPYLLTPLHAKSGSESGRYTFTFATGQTWTPPEGTYPRFSKQTLARLEEEGRLRLDPSGKKVPQRKTYLNDVGDRMPATTFWSYTDYGSTRQSNKEVAELVGKGVFQNPKPTKLLMNIIDIVDGDDFTVLDFFAGSGSTAHAVFKLNLEDGGNRRFISVQLPEPLANKTQADGASFERISDISRARIDRAGRRIQETLESEKDSQSTPLDLGFRAYTLVDSNFAKWSVDSSISEEELQQEVLALENSANKEASVEELLTEVLLKQGLSLTEKIEEVEIAGLSLCAVRSFDSEDSGASEVDVLMYLDEHNRPTLEQLRKITATKPTRLVILEDIFQGNDELKTNLVQMCKTSNIELWTA
jgi:adenine-specific DNA-methyltransferase